jgi:hypothetical protein
MSSGLSSDQIIKNQIINEVGWQIGDIELRIFPEGSNDDQIPFAKGGLTFGYNGVLYGSCDAVWYIDNKRFLDRYNNKFINQKPIIALEGTDALQRGSTGNAQYQRFHHALGAVKNGIIGIYYLKPGKDMIQYDLYGMAYFASQREKGYYLIVQNLSIVKEILELVDSFGLESQQVKNYIDNYLKFMYEQWYENKFSTYNYDWNNFAKRRSTLIIDNKIIKYAGRMRRNFTDSSQRAGHIAVGEMYLTKYYFYNKDFYYLFPRMTLEDLEYLDNNKKDDKEWYLLRNEENVYIKTMDDLIGLPNEIRKSLISISEVPLKGDALRLYNSCMKQIMAMIKNGKIKIRE